MNEHQKTYDLIQNDPLSWLEEAQGALMSAHVIEAELARILPLSQTLPGIREKKLAFMHSFMLLAGLAFENIIKGIYVAQKHDWRELGEAGGHGTSIYASRVTNISPFEKDLLARLQEYVI